MREKDLRSGEESEERDGMEAALLPFFPHLSPLWEQRLFFCTTLRTIGKMAPRRVAAVAAARNRAKMAKKFRLCRRGVRRLKSGVTD